MPRFSAKVCGDFWVAGRGISVSESSPVLLVSAAHGNLPGWHCEYPFPHLSRLGSPWPQLPFPLMAFPLQFLLETIVSSALMSKDKKQHSKKDAASADILDLAHASIKKFRKVTREIGKLSTGQKLVGGLALAAAGLAYLAARDNSDEAAAPESNPPHAIETEVAPVAPRKHPKRPRFAAEE